MANNNQGFGSFDRPLEQLAKENVGRIKAYVSGSHYGPPKTELEKAVKAKLEKLLEKMPDNMKAEFKRLCGETYPEPEVPTEDEIGKALSSMLIDMDLTDKPENAQHTTMLIEALAGAFLKLHREHS
ncbi:MAG: hypothetical protein RBS05_16285 [Zoogloea oleivorans]|jgi:hypothetical protein|uniref:hypothetical protein n=1 Tax=Zoogloea oleivorans TaxID=1552750 RepID=UPI002A35D5E2|nr:hypothetical protein [Zoogloea oleivorans]MDY0037469.1 hypothetical protein [Zoogloea oleivorans]